MAVLLFGSKAFCASRKLRMSDGTAHVMKKGEAEAKSIGSTTFLLQKEVRLGLL